MQATYTKLRNGFWGLRVTGFQVTPQNGDTVTATRRDGRQKRETIGRVLWCGDGIAICSKQAGDVPVFDRGAVRDPGEDAADRWNETHGDLPGLMALAERFS